MEQNTALSPNDGRVNGQKDEIPIMISSLINSVEYFLEIVFIMTVKDGYRLLVIQRHKLLTDRTFKNAKGARISFQLNYKDKAWKNNVKANWSPFYPPGQGWIDKKLSKKKLIDGKHNRYNEIS